MLGCRSAVKLISNSQTIYYCSSLSSWVSGALSVFRITLAAHCYWLQFRVRQNFGWINENRCRLIELNCPVHVLQISKIHSVTFDFTAFLRCGVRSDPRRFWTIQNNTLEEQKTFANHILFVRFQRSHCSVFINSLLSSRWRCSTSTF